MRVQVRAAAEGMKINLRYPSSGVIQVSFDETVTEADLADVVSAFEGASSKKGTAPAAGTPHDRTRSRGRRHS